MPALVEPEKIQHPRHVERLVTGLATSDGAGVKLTRVLTQDLQRRLDPFLMLDAFGSDDPDDYIAGFPEHPHRGFETITYMIAGRMQHRDSAGHEGLLENGGMQWMTAGRGVIHAEIPQQEHGVMEGFQLWLNLPSTHKMCAPWYRDFPAHDLPRFTRSDGVTVTLLAGTTHGQRGAVQREITAPQLIDIHLPAGATFATALPAAYNAFVYVYRGCATIEGTRVESQRMAILANDSSSDGIQLTVTEDSRVLLVAGQPLGEPIAQHGPFVMNTQQELQQAIQDYRQGRFA